MTGREPPPLVRVELVTVDGAEGQVLEERQLAVIREVRAWIHRHPRSADEPPHQRAA
jgi:hypothetical protein